jgi:hypothetical protein
MIKLGKESKLAPREVIEQAVDFFGPSGWGLKVVNQDECCARFEGSGGYVYTEAAEIDGHKGSDVSIEGREWEYQIRRFVEEI